MIGIDIRFPHLYALIRTDIHVKSAAIQFLTEEYLFQVAVRNPHIYGFLTDFSPSTECALHGYNLKHRKETKVGKIATT